LLKSSSTNHVNLKPTVTTYTMALPAALLTALGTLTLTLLFLRLSRFLYLYLRPSSLPRYLHSPDNHEPWALITGIGKTIAHTLTQHGFNIIILHGRNASKLSSLAATLHHSFPARRFRPAVLDASLASSTADLHLTVLVNNVAGGIVVQPLTATSRPFTGKRENAPLIATCMVATCHAVINYSFIGKLI